MTGFLVSNRLSDNISKTPEGYLLCTNVPVARTGELIYAAEEVPGITPDSGIVVVTRDASELFRDSTIASANGKPITLLHPNEFVSPENWKDVSVGVPSNFRRGSGALLDCLVCDILITDEKAIEAVSRGDVREISIGYHSDTEETSPGKANQKNIVINHIALVENGRGRCGPTCAIQDEGPLIFIGNGKETNLKLFGRKTKDEASEEERKEEEMEAKDSIEEVVAKLLERLEKVEERLNLDEEGEEEGVSAAEDSKEKAQGKTTDSLPDESSAMKSFGAKFEQLRKAVVGLAKRVDSIPTQDDISRLEILNPGAVYSGKISALKESYKTKEGRRVIDSILGGKTLDSLDEEAADIVFRGASEIFKRDRAQATALPSFSQNAGSNDIDEMNKINAKLHGRA